MLKVLAIQLGRNVKPYIFYQEPIEKYWKWEKKASFSRRSIELMFLVLATVVLSKIDWSSQSSISEALNIGEIPDLLLLKTLLAGLQKSQNVLLC